MKEIALIAPYGGLAAAAANVIEAYGYRNVEVIEGDLQEGVMAAQQAVDQGARVLISRGGTFTRIREQAEVPVVEIQISAYDIMENLKNILDGSEPVAVMGYGNVIFGYELLLSLRKNVRQVQIGPGESPEEKILECVNSGIRVFAGDAVVNRICSSLGYTCYMLQSGKEAIGSAIEEAGRILLASNQEQERAKRYMALIDYVHDGVVATDDQERILLFNSVAERVLGIKKEEVIGRRIHEVPGLGLLLGRAGGKQRTVVDSICKLGRTQITISGIPISVNGQDCGVVAVFQDVTALQDYEQKVRAKLAEKGFVARYSFDSIVYRSQSIEHCISMARKFSQYDSDILIQGQSGVGKELFAQSIHNESRRRSAPFVAVNCAALPESILESELFGYVEGAFTGSRPGGKAGMFELAHRGTVFLDEISELPVGVQGRLLRVIQEREIMRLGDDKVIPLDVRIICATNRDLSAMVKAGQFRRDLLYRINTLSFFVPPLKERREDVEALALHFLERFNKRYSKQIKGFSNTSLSYLQTLDYEGNARELRGIVERAVILCEGENILPGDLYQEKGTDGDARAQESILPAEGGAVTLQGELQCSLRELEDRYIQEIYEKTGGSVSKSCQILKIDRTTLWRKLKTIAK